MRVMLMHKSTPDTEAGIVPPASLIQAVDAMIGDMEMAHLFRDGAGLRASSLGVRLTFTGGKRSETLGPFTGRNEMVAALGIVKTHTREEAVEIATQLAAILGDGECDIRPVTEPWDLGFAERPAGLDTTRYMLVWKGNAAWEAGALPSLQARSALAQLLKRLAASGVWLQGEAFRPSRESKRIPLSSGKRHAVDGPFAESKELISGFCTIEVPSMAAALPWAERYIAAVEGVELDIRPLYEASELA